MKRQIVLILCILAAIACKKNEDPQPEGFLSSVKYMNGSSFNLTYKLFYKSDKKLDRISFKGTNGPNTLNNHYFMHYNASGKLDSIVVFDSIALVRLGSAAAVWTGERMTSFWNSTYTYDVQGRISNTVALSGNSFRANFLADSTENYFDPSGPDPEYLSWVTYRAVSVKNPFRIKNNESLFPINNYVFNFINTTIKDGGFEFAESKSALYTTGGAIEYVVSNNYEGNISSYPTKAITTYSTSAEVRTLEFTYQ